MVDNPGNNYHFSFLEATMTWGFASDSPTWLDLLAQEKLPALVAYFPGCRAVAAARAPATAWRRCVSSISTGSGATRPDEDLAALSSHLADSIDYWIHATVPTLDRYAPIGDLARERYPWLYDYHRRLVLEARAMATDPPLAARAAWWLHRISIGEMTSGFNFRHDLLPAGTVEAAPAPLRHHATGTGHLFARSSWRPDAVWASFVAGPYDQSHAHQDQGAFNLFAGDFLAVTENVFSHSGIEQGSEIHNTLRFERAGAIVGQHECVNTMTVTGGAGGRTVAVADLAAAFAGTGAVTAWQRTLDFDAFGLTVSDAWSAAGGVTAVFQVNVPTLPSISGGVATAGALRIRPLVPANPTLSILDWATSIRPNSTRVTSSRSAAAPALTSCASSSSIR